MAEKSLTNMIAELYHVRQTVAQFKKTEDSLMATIKPLADAELAKLSPGVKSELTDGIYTLVRVGGTNSRVDPQLLLSRGVAPDIIDSCTKRTTYFQYKVNRL
jgi:hypothetical protein